MGKGDQTMAKSAQSQLNRSNFYKRTQPSDELVFLRAWLRAPLATATMLPSGPQLSRALAATVDPKVPGAVVELGPGTGPVTAALVERGVAPDRLILIEFNPDFCRLLQERYPTARVIEGDAFAAPALVEKLKAAPLAAVVSCLPLYGKTPELRQRLLMDMLKLGAPGIPFVQATNFPRSPIPIDSSAMTASVSKRIWRNLFPALVWTYRLTAAR
jgi:phosphatidylethanolamine/phosphatidyl-N-methylethanolamine N-methyltransferase